jgi:hypothetical protein
MHALTDALFVFAFALLFALAMTVVSDWLWPAA